MLFGDCYIVPDKHVCIPTPSHENEASITSSTVFQFLYKLSYVTYNTSYKLDNFWMSSCSGRNKGQKLVSHF